MNGLAPRRRRAAEFARLADLAVDRPGADVAKQLAEDEESVRLVTITQALREIEVAAGPDEEFRDRLRRQLVAHATVTAPAGRAVTPVVPAPRGGRAQRLTAGTGSPRLAFLAGTLAALVLISGLTLLASSRAVPGDTLYGIKRSSEQLELALVHDPQDRGNRQLTFARNRLNEVGALVDRTGAGLGPTGAGNGTLVSADTDRMLDVLVDMDRNTGEGAALITGLAVQQRSDQLLTGLAGWVSGQRSVLAALQPRMPSDAADRAGGSIRLLDRLAQRVAQLLGALGCTCMQNPVRDDLGPVPCMPCVPPPSRPGGTSVPSPNPSGGGQPTGGAGAPNGGQSAPPPPTGTGPPGGQVAPPARGTAPPVQSAPTVGGGNGTLPTASVLPSMTPDAVCKLLGKLLCHS